MPIYLIILFAFLAVYFFIGSIFLSYLRMEWSKIRESRYRELIEFFSDNPLKALKFGLTWPLTFTHLWLHLATERGVGFKRRFLESAAGHAEEVISGGEHE
jgi:hypothetical protein